MYDGLRRTYTLSTVMLKKVSMSELKCLHSMYPLRWREFNSNDRSGHSIGSSVSDSMHRGTMWPLRTLLLSSIKTESEPMAARNGQTHCASVTSLHCSAVTLPLRKMERFVRPPQQSRSKPWNYSVLRGAVSRCSWPYTEFMGLPD